MAIRALPKTNARGAATGSAVPRARSAQKRLGTALAFGLIAVAAPSPAHADPPKQIAKTDDVEDLKGKSLEDLLNVKVVTGSLQEETRFETPVVVSVITAKQIRDYQYESVAEAVSYLPGFDMLYDFAHYNVGVRGVNGGTNAQSQVVKTMINGKDIGFRPTTGSFLGPELIPMAAVNRIEVVRGPASVLYGANAFLGVINIIPQRAKDMGEGVTRERISYISSWGRPGASAEAAVWGTPLGIDTMIAVSGQHVDRSGLKLPKVSPSFSKGEIAFTHLDTRDDIEQTASAYARMEKAIGKNGSITADGNLQFLERNLNFASDSSPMSNGRTSLLNGTARLQYQQKIGEMLELNAFGGYSAGGPTDRERLLDTRRLGFDYMTRDMGYNAWEGRVEASLVPTDWPFKLTAGGDFSFETETLTTLTGIRKPDPPLSIGVQDRSTEDIRDIGGFVLGTLNLWKTCEEKAAGPDGATEEPTTDGAPKKVCTAKFSVVGGVRVEEASAYQTQVSYRAGLVYLFTPTFSAKLLAGRSFKAPSPTLRNGVPVVIGGPEPNPDLEAQDAFTTELYVGGRLPGVKQLEIGASGYYTRINGFAEVDITNIVPEAFNSGTIDAFGSELELHATFGKQGFQGFANGSYVHAKKSSATDDSGPTGPAVETALYPTFMANVGLSQTLESLHLQFSGALQVRSARRADYTNVVKNGAPYEHDPYATLAFGVSTVGIHLIKNRETRISAKVRNALDAHYVEPGFLGTDVPAERLRLTTSLEQTF